MSHLQVTRKLCIKQFLLFRLIVRQECTKFKRVIIDEISALTLIYLINKGYAFHRGAVSFDGFNALTSDIKGRLLIGR